MKLSEQLKRDHESGDFGNALSGYSERAAQLEVERDRLAAENAELLLIIDTWLQAAEAEVMEWISESQRAALAKVKESGER